MTRMLKKESIINLDFLFADHGWDWHQFDERAYQRSASNFIIVATSLATGKAVTFEKPTGDDLITALKASSSIPLLATRILATRKKRVRENASTAGWPIQSRTTLL